VKAACGKTARAVWAADGGQHEMRCATSDPTPVNPQNKVAQAAAEVGEGRVQLKENIGLSEATGLGTAGTGRSGR